MAIGEYLGVQTDHVCMSRPHVYGTRGAVSSNSSYATQAGLEILKAGGNAMDAAAATSLVLGVTEPYHSGIGGGCFQVIYHKDSNQFYCVDARGVAPMGATEDMFLGPDGEPDPNLTEYSGRSVALPAQYRALDILLSKFGTMTLEQVSAPAIKLAREGFQCGFTYARTTNTTESVHNAKAYEGFSELYLNHGGPRTYGEVIRNPALAETMEQVAKNGVDWFYTGPIAETIVKYVNRYQGVLTMEDMASCRAIERTPVRGNYRGYDIISMSPPSSGGMHLIQMLNILENFDLAGMGHLSAQEIHVIAETMKMMFADRSVATADPAFVQVNVEKITSKEYAKDLAARIDMDHAQDFAPTEGIEAKEYNGCTSNFEVMDRFGNVVVQTQTIRNWWGCGVTIPEYGFIMNNNMADFSAKAGTVSAHGLSYGTANRVQPGKTSISSMAPTIVMKDGVPFLAVGAAGGPRIITSTLQMILNVIDHGMMMNEAVRPPHICCLSLGQSLEMERGVSPDTQAILAQKGHHLLHLHQRGSLLVLPNGIQCMDGTFYPGGTCRVDGAGGVLTEAGNIAMDGMVFME